MQEEEPKDWGVLLWLVKVLAFPFSLFGSSLEMGAEPSTLCAGDSLATPALHRNEPKDISSQFPSKGNLSHPRPCCELCPYSLYFPSICCMRKWSECFSSSNFRYQAIPRMRELKISTEKPGVKLPFPSMASKPMQTAFYLLLLLSAGQLSPACLICLWLLALPRSLRRDWKDEHPSPALSMP